MTTAERQVSLLRGVNVAGHNRVAMTNLRALYEGLGCTDVETYVQSGNVVFSSSLDPDRIRLDVEAAIRSEFGLEIRVLGRSHGELERIVATDIFGGADPAWRHVVFLSETLPPETVDAVLRQTTDDLVAQARVETFIPVLAERQTRARLVELARPR